MAGKRASDYEDKKARIKRVAARVMANRPFDSGSWGAVSREMNTSSTAIVYYWGNMDNLLWAVIWDHVRNLLDRLGEGAPPELPPRERIVGVCRAYCRVVEEYGAEHRTVMTHQFRLSPARKQDLKQVQRWILDFVIEVIASALPQADQRRATPLALTLLSLLNGHADWFRDGKDVSRGGFADMAARMVLSELPSA